MTTDTEFNILSPRWFYINDDVSGRIGDIYGVDSCAYSLVQELFALMQTDSERVIILTLQEQIEQLLALGSHPPFAVTVCIGRAGERVAEQLHERTDWFPIKRRLDITREEDGCGEYNLVSLDGSPMECQLKDLDGVTSLAVVDDTLYSGLTLSAVLRALPSDVLQRTHVFCLKGIAETIPAIEALCPINVGVAAPGRINQEVSMINASGMVMPVGIRTSDGNSLAFFERPSWVRAWFPGYADEVVAICGKLSAVLEPSKILA